MLLTMKDEQRLKVIQGVMDRQIRVGEAGRILHRCERTVFRVLKRVREDGARGVVHRGRGRRHPRRVSDTVRSKVVDLALGPYKDINDTQFTELLASREHVVLSRETIRRVLRAAKVAPKRRRRQGRYRSRRERKEAFGMMLQIDASVHDWLEGRGPLLTLVGARDDATGYVWARFVTAETLWAYMDLMRDVFTSHGRPLSLYSDRHAIFHTMREPTIVEQLTDTVPLTQFGRAMDELGIGIIKAWSPQAKGRIERLWGILQDRLVVALRLADASTLAKANACLAHYLVTFNQKFTVLARSAQTAFRKAPPATLLDTTLCVKDSRVVNKDHTISFEGLALQLPPSRHYHAIAGKRVVVLQFQDGALWIAYRGKVIVKFSPEAITRMLKDKQNIKSDLRVNAA